MNSAGNLVMGCILETKVITILQFVQGLNGNLNFTFGKRTWAAWLYDMLKPLLRILSVCSAISRKPLDVRLR